MRKFSLKTSTIFEDSPIGLDKWLPALWLLVNCKNGISSCELARDLKVTQKTAWFMLHRLRYAMQGEDGGMLSGEIEVDETFIGGKARNMHKSKREEKITGRGPEGKAIVAAVLRAVQYKGDTGPGHGVPASPCAVPCVGRLPTLREPFR
jgi:hypothetical protein